MEPLIPASDHPRLHRITYFSSCNGRSGDRSSVEKELLLSIFTGEDRNTGKNRTPILRKRYLQTRFSAPGDIAVILTSTFMPACVINEMRGLQPTRELGSVWWICAREASYGCKSILFKSSLIQFILIWLYYYIFFHRVHTVVATTTD